MRTLVLWTMVALAGCAGADGDEDRGEIAEEDLVGSCSAATSCGEKSDGGNCWCDDACLGFGDCCSDKPLVCPGGLTFVTYNAGLAHGAVPFADERIQPIIQELRDSPADVLCMQEVWTDADARAIIDGVRGEFPYFFREATTSDSSEAFACDPSQWSSLYSMSSCVAEQCTPSGISAFECAADQCAPEWGALDDGCKLCIAANTTSPTTCAAGIAPMYGNEGRNGIILMSRQPLEDITYTPFETHVIKRGVIEAEVGGLHVQCTHMTAELNVVPYPAGGSFASWREEHAAQVTLMANRASAFRRSIMLGDLNTGPASPGVDGELPANYESLVAAGYVDTWTSGQTCTYCQDNPLACSRPGGCDGGLSSRLDHVLMKGVESDITLAFERFADEPITIVDAEGVSHEGRLSDHYGVMATLPY